MTVNQSISEGKENVAPVLRTFFNASDFLTDEGKATLEPYVKAYIRSQQEFNSNEDMFRVRALKDKLDSKSRLLAHVVSAIFGGKQ